MDLEKIKKLVKTDCYGEKDEIINEAVLICLETSCDEETAVKKAFKKFKREFWDKKFNYAAPLIDDDGEDLRDNYIFVDKGEEETFNRLDENLRERGKKLCETACVKELYEQGLLPSQIANKLNKSMSVIQWTLRRLKLGCYDD